MLIGRKDLIKSRGRERKAVNDKAEELHRLLLNIWACPVCQNNMSDGQRPCSSHWRLVASLLTQEQATPAAGQAVRSPIPPEVSTAISVPADRGDSPVGIVIVEDSAIHREALVNLYEEDPQLRVLAQASTGLDAVEKVLEHKPDLVTLDLGLPDIDGFEVVRRVMADCPTPIVIITATLAPNWRKPAFHALTLGAIDVMEKPKLAELNDPAWRRRFQRQLRLIAKSPVVPHVLYKARQRSERVAALRQAKKPEAQQGTLASAGFDPEVLVIVGSSGGATAVRMLLAELRPAHPLPVPIVVAMHLGPRMGKHLARYLAQCLEVRVVEMEDGDELTPGVIYVAPGGMQSEMVSKGRVRVFDPLPESLYSPSLDHFLASVARAYGPASIGIILSGMGKDGAQGLLAVRRSGALTLGQVERSCLIYGMPKKAREAGAVVLEQSIQEMAQTILERLNVAARDGERNAAEARPSESEAREKGSWPQQATSMPAKRSDSPVRIVVIEDSEIHREALVSLYQEDPQLQVVAQASTGLDGVGLVLEHKPDLVTLDLGLPDVDGFEVVRRIMAEWPTPILIVTATLTPKWREPAFHALTLGAIDVMEKPELAELTDATWRRRVQRQLRLIARSPVVPHLLHKTRQRRQRLAALRDDKAAKPRQA